MKLSAKQKEIIRLMREGYKCKPKDGRFLIIHNNGITGIYVNTQIVAKLLGLDIMNSVFKLTELGKTIEL